jgi:4-hydroxy-3-polyprenylbenzoate decarboxylase
MSYRSLQECVADLEATKRLVRIEAEIDPRLEMAEIQRRLFQAQGPAVLFTRPKGSRFPMLANLFGTLERARYLFRDTLPKVRRLIELKIDPLAALAQPLKYAGAPLTALTMAPKFVRSGPVLAHTTTIGALPKLVSWPADGGAFVTLPQVYSEDPDRPGWRNSNLGMYRVQLSGGRYEPDQEIGLHYQLHRGIGVHHAAALRRGEALRVNVFVGGPPAMTLAAVMPLPEGLSELSFAGPLGGRRVRLAQSPTGLPVAADADFCIVGTVDPAARLPEGPFGDHLGYYSLAHDFPVLRVERVYHREGAIWPFTVVGRPPQEDTIFGELIHELTGPIIPTVIAGVRAVHAVDAAGVHPLLLAIGSERYVPFEPLRRPRELLTQANAILGQGQLSLAKYLFIADGGDEATPDLHDVAAFLQHVLARADWRTDLHFQTRTTIDTLDYSGSALNEGSKLVIAVAGPARRPLPTALTDDPRLPDGFSDPRVALPGVLVVRGPYAEGTQSDDPAAAPPRYVQDLERFCTSLPSDSGTLAFPLIVVVDDSEFAAGTLNNFVWTTFTRSNPAADVYGIGAFTHQKHWGCSGPLVIDARIKAHHAPPLVEDPEVSRRVDALAAQGGPLHGLI